MFKKLRNRFVVINMLSITAVAVAALLGIYFALRANTLSQNEAKLQQYTPVIITSIQSADDETGRTETSTIQGEFLLPVGYTPSFQLLTDTEGNITANDSLLDLPQKAYEQIAAQALSGDKSGSVMQIDDTMWQYHVSTLAAASLEVHGDDGTTHVRQSEEGYIITCLDVSDSYAGLRSLAFTLAMVGLGMLVLFFFTSLLFANRAIKPISATWEGQKRFVADASHELKTPLAIINANMEAMLSNPEQTVSSQRRWIDHSRQAIDRTSRLINDMLTLSALESPAAPSFAAQDMSDIVQNAIFSMEAVIFERGLTLRTRIAKEVSIYGDADRMGRLVIILLENAVKYCNPGGSIDVVLEDGRQQVLAVTNTGQGIAEQHLPHIFDRFYRGDSSHSSQGYGLGLSLAKAIADSMHARIEARSTEGEYAQFIVTFPQP